MDITQIISGCKTGDRLAQKAFVQQYSSFMFTICRRYVKDTNMAQDCLQESMIQVLNNMDKYNEQGKFESWIATITVRKCISHLRKEKKVSFSDIDSIPMLKNQENCHYSLELEDVYKFINTLPENYRVVINMYLVEGYSHKEIAKYLGIIESSSRSILTRARKLIQNAFEDQEIYLKKVSQ